MRVNILTNPVAGGWSPWDTRLGGSEESYVEWAVELRRRGHDVDLYICDVAPGEYLGVRVRPYFDYFHRKPGLTLNCNWPDHPVEEPTVYFNNRTDAGGFDLGQFQAIIHPSEWARDYLRLDHEQQFIVPHGYDPETIYYDPDEKIPQTVLYASSPDRGLRELERVWPEVVDAVPAAQLMVTYGGKLEGPHILNLGSVDGPTMAGLYRACDIWCHPCTGVELFGITAVKAQVAGCYPVFYPTMALQETVRFGTMANPDNLATHLIGALRSHPEVPRMDFADWNESTDLLEKVLEKCYN